MPLYEHIILTLPKCSSENLVDLFRKYGKTILEYRGNLRGIQNHGVRPLPAITARKYPSSDGSKKFWEARYSSAIFDGSPECLKEADRMLRNEDAILRIFVIKHKSILEMSTGKNYKNPLLNIK